MTRYIYLKNILDTVAAAVLLLLCSWALLLMALVIKLDDLSSPVMYNATRIGKALKPFTMYKFRTMKPSFEGAGRVTAASLTKPGAFLRKTGLDELPQLFNILKGDMSFIGPRPLTERYAPWYTKRQNMRHLVRPGLTGLAQVSGRVTLDWDKRFELDAQYVENLSLRRDLQIVFRTFGRLKGDDALVTEESILQFDYFDDFQRDQITRKLVRPSELISDVAEKEMSVSVIGERR